MRAVPDPTFSLLLAAIRHPLGEGLADQARGGIDWERFVGLARRHRVSPLAFRAVLAAGMKVPAAFAAQFEESCRTALFAEMTFATELGRLQQLLGVEGIIPILLKGPGTSLRAFGELGLRTYRDLDLLVVEDAVAPAEAVLDAAGYQRIEPRSDLASTSLPAWRKDHKDALFRHDETGLLVELHWRLFDNRSLMTSERLPQPVALGLPPLEATLVLPVDAELEYLCVHGALHGWSRLRWLADVNALLGSVPEEALLKAARSVPAAAQALTLCRDLLGSTFDSELNKVLDGSMRGRWLARLAWSEILRSGTRELEAVPFGSTVKNLSHYVILEGAGSVIEELRFDFTAQPRAKTGRKGRISDWMSRHLLNR